MLGRLVLVNFWTLCTILLFRTEHSVSETRFYFFISGQDTGVCLFILSPIDEVTVHHWTRPCKYVHACLYIKLAFISPSITSCFTFYNFVLWNCLICWLHHRNIGVPFPPEPDFFVFTTTFKSSQTPHFFISGGYLSFFSGCEIVQREDDQLP